MSQREQQHNFVYFLINSYLNDEQHAEARRGAESVLTDFAEKSVELLRSVGIDSIAHDMQGLSVRLGDGTVLPLVPAIATEFADGDTGFSMAEHPFGAGGKGSTIQSQDFPITGDPNARQRRERKLHGSS